MVGSAHFGTAEDDDTASPNPATSSSERCSEQMHARKALKISNKSDSLGPGRTPGSRTLALQQVSPGSPKRVEAPRLNGGGTITCEAEGDSRMETHDSQPSVGVRGDRPILLGKRTRVRARSESPGVSAVPGQLTPTGGEGSKLRKVEGGGPLR